MSGLVLSLFPGIGLLDLAFEEAGFCVVRGPDVLWGGDIRRFTPPPGRFDGVIGGPPCQAFSSLAHLVRANGYEPKFGNLIPEFERCVLASAAAWFLMEEVPDAPVPTVEGYGVHSFLLNNRQLGETQNRVRRWSFGWRGGRLILHVQTQVFEHPDFEHAAFGRPKASLRKHQRMNSAVFRNEGPTLSSSLIREADEHADRKWPEERRHYTYADPMQIRSSNAGFCFLCAGWRRCGRTRSGLVVLCLMPECKRVAGMTGSAETRKVEAT